MIPLFKVYMSPTAGEEVTKVLNSGYIGQGPKVDQLEENLQEYFNQDRIFTTNSATSAEHLSIHLLKKPIDKLNYPGYEDGDEVLCPSLTCTATNWPVLANRLNIKWVDIDSKNLNMDLDDLERKLSPKTKIILLVHWGGYPVDLDRIEQIKQKCFDLYGFKPMVIEDCAHAFGSKYKKRLIGTHGNICTFSMQAIKHVTSVDGGFIVSPTSEFYRRGKLTRWYGIDREGDRKDFRCEADIEEWGFKFHMNDVMATVGIENLKHADEIIKGHKNNAKYYDTSLKDVNGVTLLERKKGFDSSFWIYSMLVENRMGFMEHMKECGISVSQVHERNDIHTCVSKYRKPLPTLDSTIGNVISIPVGWWVTEENREYIVDCIKKGW